MTAGGAISLSAVEAGLVALADARATPAQQAAAEGFARSGLPHRRMEAFKWTDFRAAVREPVARASAPDTTPSTPPSRLPAHAQPKPFDIDAYEIEIADGVVEISAFARDGLDVRTTPNDRALPDALAAHPLALLAAATASRRTDIFVKAQVAEPVWVRRMARAGASASRLRITLAPGASLTLIESYEAGEESFAADTVEIDLGEGASFTRYVVQDGAESAVVASVAQATLAAGARFEQAVLAFGGKLVRIETRIEQEGDGAEIMLHSASLASGARHIDQTSFVAHRALGGRTKQLHKAALKGRSRSVFQGKFHVARGAQKTDADMQAKALLLSDGAEAFHKPELEIYADDVQCAHGAASGALDTSALFYLRQRGLSEASARALLIEAFLVDVIDGVAHPAMREIFSVRASRWLEAV